MSLSLTLGHPLVVRVWRKSLRLLRQGAAPPRGGELDRDEMTHLFHSDLSSALLTHSALALPLPRDRRREPLVLTDALRLGPASRTGPPVFHPVPDRPAPTRAP